MKYITLIALGGLLLVGIVSWHLIKLKMSMSKRVFINSLLLIGYWCLIACTGFRTNCVQYYIHLLLLTVLGLLCRYIIPHIWNSDAGKVKKDSSNITVTFEQFEDSSIGDRIRQTRLTYTILKLIIQLVLVASCIWDF